MIFCSCRPRRTTRRIRGRAVKALRSGRSQLCWRGFESHRMQHLFVFFVDPRLLSIELAMWLGGLHQRLCRWRGGAMMAGNSYTSTLVTRKSAQTRASGGYTKSSLGGASHTNPTKKGYGGTGIRARVKRITTAYANHYTIPPRLEYRC
jgi:hypothetical protein